MSTCDGCKFWSDKIARVDNTGQIRAVCLNKASVNRADYVFKGCWKYEEGDAVDLDLVEEQVS